MKRIGLIGAGKLAQVIAGALSNGKVPGCNVVAVLGRDVGRTESFARQHGCVPCYTAERLLQEQPDYVIEAATAQALRQHGEPILSAGCSIICISMGVFNDQAYYDRIAQIALEHNAKVYMASGVIGGIDIAAAISLMDEAQGTIIKYRYPSNSKGNSSKPSFLPDQFEGSTREGYLLAPAHMNIAVAGGLVFGSLDKTRMVLKPVDPSGPSGFGVTAENSFLRSELSIWQNLPGKQPFKTTELAAWSAVALLKRLIDPITF